MNAQQKELLDNLEALMKERLQLLRLYPVLSVDAMQRLENDDLEGFVQKLNERDALTADMDALSSKMEAQITRLDPADACFLMPMVKPGTDIIPHPDWVTAVAQLAVQTQRLLKSCALLNAKLVSRAEAAESEIRSHIQHVQAERRIRNTYTVPGAASTGTHVLSSTK